jgi:hypothetical protein
MKKLNLKFKGIGEMLNKEQMKKIIGGDYQDCPPPGGCDLNYEYLCTEFDVMCYGDTRYYCSDMMCLT